MCVGYSQKIEFFKICPIIEIIADISMIQYFPYKWDDSYFNSVPDERTRYQNFLG